MVRYFYLSIFLTAFISGCGGGSGSPNSTLNTGVLVDSAVWGVSYHTATKAGTTNSQGEFSYNEGEIITFSIGDLAFPPVTAIEIITPITLAEASSIMDQEATNIARLLQSLDEDGDPLNGIKIPSSAALVATQIDFDVDALTFESNPDVINLVANSGSVNTSIVSVVNAQAHVTDTLLGMSNSEVGSEVTIESYNPVQISVGTSYSGSISEADIGAYTFTAGSSGVHTISLSDVTPEDVDLSWTLYHIDTDDVIAECDNDAIDYNEICETPSLVQDENYLIQVTDFSSIGAEYGLLVSQEEAPAPIIENEGSTIVSDRLTIQLTYEGVISANGTNVYYFETGIAYVTTISLLNAYGVNLDWSLYDAESNLVHECKNDQENGNELCFLGRFLARDSTYFVSVHNHSNSEATFDLKVY